MSKTLCALLSLAVLLCGAAASAQTTLASLTANNTSACSATGELPGYCKQAFPGQVDARPNVGTRVFDPPAGNVSDEDAHAYLNHGYKTKIFANVMLGFCAYGDDPQYCHRNVRTGYNSNDASTIAAQAEDMKRRHIDGAVLVWEGNGTSEDEASKKFRAYTEEHDCPDSHHCKLQYVLMYDGPSIGYTVTGTGVRGTTGMGCSNKKGADFENCAIAHLRNDMCSMNASHWGSKAYLKQDGRPVLLVFPAEEVIPASGPAPSWTDVWLHVDEWNHDLPHNCSEAPYNAKNGVPMIVFENANGFRHSGSSGAYYWIQPAGTDPSAQFLFNIDAPGNAETLEGFLEVARSQKGKQVWSAGFKGFNSAGSAWGANRITDQACGQSWIKSLTASNRYYSSDPIPFLQIITWNDYNEGTEIESGIDNCYTVAAEMNGQDLQWNLRPSNRFANLDTVSHMEIYDSSDGENLRLLANLPAAVSGAWSAASLSPGRHQLFVRMVGKNSILNRISAPVTYSR